MSQEIPLFKIRASMAWVLLTNPKEKKNKLSVTTITYLKQWIIEQKYGRKKEFATKYTEKGNQTEQDGLQLIQDVLYPDGSVFISKSKQYYEDDFKTGHLDAFTDEPLDNKSSFTVFTFPFSEEEIPEPKYIPQMNVYMDFTGTETSKVCFTLNNTPFEIVDKELNNWRYKNGIAETGDMPESIAYEIVKNHVYTRDALKMFSYAFGTYDTSDFIEIPKEKRLKYFVVKKDNALIEKLHNRVIVCRQWIADNWDKF